MGSGAGPILFSTRSYAAMAAQIGRIGGFEAGRVERERFPDGELYQRLESQVADRDAVLVGGTIDADDTLEIYDLATALVNYGARSLTLVIPYFAYSTMERAVLPGEVVTAKTRARLLSGIPIARRGNHVVLLDLHSEGISHYFEGAVCPVHLSCRSLAARAAKRLAGDDFVIACTDAGRAKWVESLACELQVDVSFVFKRREKGATLRLSAVSAQVEKRRVVIYDDMVRSGASLLQAARAYRDAGAGEIFALATHGVLPGDALQRIRASGLFSAMLCTDSHPRAIELAGDFLRIESVTTLLADHLRTHLCN